MGEHAVRLQHLEGLADQSVRPVKHLVDLAAQALQRLFQTDQFEGRVVSQQLFWRDGRLVQNHHADRQTFGEAQALQALGPVGRKLHALELGGIDDLAGGDHLGQHHGDGLQILDLVLVVDAGGAVLDHQHPDGPAAPQQRNAEEAVVGIFARFRMVGEVRVDRRVGQVDRPACPHDLADQAFARPHAGDVHGLGLQTLRGEQLHVGGRPAQVKRAHLRHHGAGDDAHHLVEPGLGRAACLGSYAQVLSPGTVTVGDPARIAA